MKKLELLMSLVLLSIPAFSADKITFTGNFTGTGHPITSTRTVDNLVLVPTNNLTNNLRTLSSDGHKTLRITKYPTISDLHDHLRITDVDTLLKKNEEKPPLNPKRIAGELLVGGAGGTLMSYGMGFGFYALTYSEGIGYFGFCIGQAIGSSIGVYWFGTEENETHSYKSTLLWSSVGAAIGTLFFIESFEVQDTPVLSILYQGLFYGLPTIGGVIGFNKTRKYRSLGETGTALIEFTETQTNLSVPTVYFEPNPFDKSDFIQTINLIKVSF